MWIDGREECLQSQKPKRSSRSSRCMWSQGQKMRRKLHPSQRKRRRRRGCNEPEGAFTCVCPPVDSGYALNRGLASWWRTERIMCVQIASKRVVGVRVCDVVGLGRGLLAVEGLRHWFRDARFEQFDGRFAISGMCTRPRGPWPSPVKPPRSKTRRHECRFLDFVSPSSSSTSIYTTRISTPAPRGNVVPGLVP